MPKGSWRKMVSQPTGEPTRKNAARLKYDVPFGIGNFFSAIPCWLLGAVAMQKTRWQKMAEENRNEAQVKPAMTSHQFGPSNFSQLSLLQTERISSSWQHYHVWNELKVETVPQQIRHKHKTIDNLMSSWRHIGCLMHEVHSYVVPRSLKFHAQEDPSWSWKLWGKTLFFSTECTGSDITSWS